MTDHSAAQPAVSAALPCYHCTPPGTVRRVVRTFTTNGQHRLPAAKLACGHSMAMSSERTHTMNAHGHRLVAQWNAGTGLTDLLLCRPDGSVVLVASVGADSEVYALADVLREQYPGLTVDVL